ncbi:MAG: helix-turn-helix transcriptional regulator [Halobacteriota archaeon]
MERGRLGGKKLFAAIIFIASIGVLAVKLLSPTPVEIFVEGNTAVTSQVPGLFTYSDVVVLIVVSLLAGSSGVYLLLYDSLGTRADVSTPAPSAPVGSMLLEERRQHWEETAKTLKDDERALYKAVIDEAIVNQSELADKTGLSRSNISRALYVLENKGLIERKRLGMGNVVLLK